MHYAFAAVIEDRTSTGNDKTIRRRFPLRHRLNSAPHLGREHERLTRHTGQCAPEALFAQAVAVVRRCIEEIHAACKGLRDRGARRFVVDGLVEIPKGRTTEPKWRRCTRSSDAAPLFSTAHSHGSCPIEHSAQRAKFS